MALIENSFPINELNLIAEKEGNANKPYWEVQKWWARRLGGNFRAIILSTFLPDGVSLFERQAELGSKELFYQRHNLGKVVLDPFMGGGTTIVEALRLGCKVIGVDIHPVAWFATKKAIEPVKLDELEEGFKQVEASVAEKIKGYYKTTCCYGHSAAVMYVFWVKKIICQRGGEEVKLFHYYILSKGKKQWTIFCPECYHIFEVSPGAKEVQCPNCFHTFNPNKGVTTKGKFRCEHGIDSVLDATKKMGKVPEAEMFAIEYYCPTCGKRGYKPANAKDKALFKQAKAEFERREHELLLPRQSVVKGVKTRDLLNYNYKYFHQMFNERQVLCLSLLLEAILKEDEEKVREALLAAFSECLNSNNMFCVYNSPARKLERLFGHHAYIPKDIPLENNVWGTKLGRGSFVACYDNIKRSIKYAQNPYDLRVRKTDKTFGKEDLVSSKEYPGDKVEAKLVPRFNELKQGNGNTLLHCHSAEDLSFLPPESVDAVITDPPYCDNVMYGELADFFYVWLRLALRECYPWFQGEYSPKKSDGELVVIPGSKKKEQSKERKEFFNGLKRCFKQCLRVLKKDGLMVFTFHHSKPWAWSGLLEAVMDAGFEVSAIYPIRSEPKGSIHRGGVNYDIPCVCRRKENILEETSLLAIKDQVWSEAYRTVQSLRAQGSGLSDEDIFVIVMGKCLQIFSKYYPNIYKENGEKLKGEEDIDRALEELSNMVDNIIKEEDLLLLPANCDEVTRLYSLYIVGRRNLTTSELKKRFSLGAQDLTELEARQLIEIEGNTVRFITPDRREEYLNKKGGGTLIDRLHLLWIARHKGEGLAKYVQRVNTSDLARLADLIFKKTGEKAYKAISENLSSGAFQQPLS